MSVNILLKLMDPNTAEPFQPVPVDSVPSEVQPPPGQGELSAPRPWFKWTIVGVAAVLIILAIVFNRLNPLSSKSTPSSTPNPITPAQTVNSQPTTVKSISHPAPVTITTVRGVINALTPSSLTVNSSGKVQTFSIPAAKDIHRVISGRIEDGTAKEAPALASDLRVGQEVFIVANIGSAEARAIYIIR